MHYNDDYNKHNDDNNTTFFNVATFRYNLPCAQLKDVISRHNQLSILEMKLIPVLDDNIDGKSDSGMLYLAIRQCHRLTDRA